MDLLHPIRLMARTDGDLVTVLHSFFLFHREEEQNKLVLDCRHPQVRKNIETVEEGMKGLISEMLQVQSSEESTHSFVMTNHDGRLYVFVRQIKNAFIGMVSALPIMSFCRNLLQHLDSEPADMLLPLIYSVCEMPIFPAPNLKYTFQFSSPSSSSSSSSSGSSVSLSAPSEPAQEPNALAPPSLKPSPPQQLSISFSALEYVNDVDLDLVVQMVMTPVMIVRAWEALIVERRILVVAKNEALLLPCCEFLRRLVAPMPFTGTFIPSLPHSGFEAVEAPGTFIIGAQVDALCEANKDLTGLVILNLDKQTITNVTSTADDPYYCAPPFLVARLIEAVTEIMMDPLSAWCNRVHDEALQDPHSEEELNRRTTDIASLFMQTNLAILSAQFCSIRAFFRSSFQLSDRVQKCFRGMQAHRDAVAKSFSCQRVSDVLVGCLQRWREHEVDLSDASFLSTPSWVELDARAMVVYDFADELPVLVLPLEEIEVVLTSTQEPDGHVFEVLLRNQLCFRFATIEKASRSVWMSLIEEKMKAAASPAPNSALGDLAGSTTCAYGCVTNESNGSGQLLRDPVMQDFSHAEVLARYLDFRDVVRSTQSAVNLLCRVEFEPFLRLCACEGRDMFQFMSEQHSFEYSLRPFISQLSPASDILTAMKLQLCKRSLPGEEVSSGEGEARLSEPRVFSVRLTAKEVSALENAVDPEDAPCKPKLVLPLASMISKMFTFHQARSQGQKDLSPEELAAVESERKAALEKEVKKQYVSDIKDAMKALRPVYNQVLMDSLVSSVEDLMSAWTVYLDAAGDEKCSEVRIDMAGLAQRIVAATNASLSTANSTPPCISPTRTPNRVGGETAMAASVTARWGDWFGGEDGHLPCSRLLRRLVKKSRPHRSNSLPIAPLLAALDGEDMIVVEALDGDPSDAEFGFICEGSADVSEEQSEALAAIVRKELAASFSSQLDQCVYAESECHLKPILESLLGFCLHSQGLYDQALSLYSRSNLVDQRLVCQCLLFIFIEQAQQADLFSELAYVCHVCDFRPTFGMHALRLCIELAHTELRHAIGGSHAMLENALLLPYLRHSVRSNRALERSHKTHITSKGVQIAWIENEAKWEALNEAYLCTKLDTTWHPCDIAANLLVRLREMLKAFMLSQTAEQYRSIVDDLLQVRLEPPVLKSIGQLSAFKKFEIETCQLQRLQISDMSVQERLAFFMNIFNLLMAHAVIKRGGQGVGMMERQAFQKSNKYNIGGFYFSLVDIKYGILRSASAAPVVLGPLSLDWNFSERDPRRQFSLPESFPNISFCLIQASATSAPLVVFNSPDTVEKDMAATARRFLKRNVHFDVPSRCILLPEVFRIYWSDFGKNKHEVIKFVAKVVGAQFQDKLREFFRAAGTNKIKIDFIPFDWTPMLMIVDK